jgi:hypothetical protein
VWDVNVCRAHTHIRRIIHALARIASAPCMCMRMWWWQTSLVLATPRHSRLAAIVARMSCHKTRQEESKMYVFFSLSFFQWKNVWYTVAACIYENVQRHTQRVVVLRHVTLWRSGKQCGILKKKKNEPAILYSRTCYYKGAWTRATNDDLMLSGAYIHKMHVAWMRGSDVDLEQKKWKFPVGGRSVCLSPLSLLTVCCATLPFFSLAVRSVSSFCCHKWSGTTKEHHFCCNTNTHSHTERVSLTTYIAIELTLKSRETTFFPTIIIYSCREFTIVRSVW